MNVVRRATDAMRITSRAPVVPSGSEPWSMVGVMRSMATSLRAGLGLGGMTFGGNRDLFAALGYKRELDIADYRDRYRRNGIAARIVESLPQATWRGGASIIEDEDPEVETAFELAFEELAKKLDLWSVLLRADILAGLGRYSAILIGAPGDLASPMGDKVTDIAYLQQYDEQDAKIENFVDREDDPNYGLPAYYMVKRTGKLIGAAVTKKVDASRIIHVAEGLLDDRVYGIPRLERVWNDLDDLEKVKGAGAEAFWLRAHQGLHFDLDKDLKMDPTEAEKVREAADELANGMRRSMATRGMKVTPLGSDVANFQGPVDSIITILAGSTGIPKRILVGTERGELSSTQDKTNWDERVQDRRMEYAEPHMLRPLIDLFIEIGALPEPKLPYQVLWPDTAVLNIVEAGAVATAWAGLNRAAGGTIVTPAEIRDRVLGLAPLDESSDIGEAETQVTVQDTPPADGEVPPVPPETKAARARRSAKRRGKARARALRASTPRRSHSHMRRVS